MHQVVMRSSSQDIRGGLFAVWLLPPFPGHVLRHPPDNARQAEQTMTVRNPTWSSGRRQTLSTSPRPAKASHPPSGNYHFRQVSDQPANHIISLRAVGRHRLALSRSCSPRRQERAAATSRVTRGNGFLVPLPGSVSRGWGPGLCFLPPQTRHGYGCTSAMMDTTFCCCLSVVAELPGWLPVLAAAAACLAEGARPGSYIPPT
jgi:hypothetical protein